MKESIEAGAKAIAAWLFPDITWDDIPEDVKPKLRQDAQAVLAAAIPTIVEAAFDAALAPALIAAQRSAFEQCAGLAESRARAAEYAAKAFGDDPLALAWQNSAQRAMRVLARDIRSLIGAVESGVIKGQE